MILRSWARTSKGMVFGRVEICPETLEEYRHRGEDYLKTRAYEALGLGSRRTE
jgi:hypothetical protein